MNKKRKLKERTIIFKMVKTTTQIHHGTNNMSQIPHPACWWETVCPNSPSAKRTSDQTKQYVAEHVLLIQTEASNKP